jgi:hypothetical protein
MARAVICVTLLNPVLFRLALADSNAVSPVEKVITMLEDLQTQVIMEGKAEAKTYDKFACFCKDLSEQKNSDITDGQNNADEMTGRIEALSADRDDITSNIRELTQLINTRTNEMADATARRKKAHIEFLKTEAELDLGVKELQGAANEIKAGTGSASLMQNTLQKVSAGISTKTTDLLAQRKHDHLLSALLADGQSTSNSADIVETIEDIERDFQAELDECRATEDSELKEYRDLMETKTGEKTEAETQLSEKNIQLGEKTRGISMNNQDLTKTSATLLDDKAYLLELTTRCNAKSKEWDQRSQMRTDEITAITTALHIMAGRVKDHTSEKTVRLVQTAARPVIVAPVSQKKDNDEAQPTGQDEVDQEPDFLQIDLSKPRSKLAELASKVNAGETKGLQKFLGAEDPSATRTRVVALLKQKAEDLNLPALEMLAAKVTADPFVKIRKLIQELIERLLQEAADEANHKGWCDKEIGKASQKRDTKAGEVKRLNQEMSANEAKRDKLDEEINQLTKEIDELKTVLAKTDKERSDESAENAATISEAEEGKEAVDEAIDVLSKFYKTAAKAELLQVEEFVRKTEKKGIDEDMPDSGFDGSYKASQGASTGILGMMEVIQSDFVRTITETEKAEKDAAKAFFEFETATKSSWGTKKVGKEAREAEHAETVNALGEAKNDMMEEQSLLDKALQELIELQPACVDTGMSYAERVAKREQEIEALKQALCTLDNEGPVQTEPGCEDMEVPE